jgi:hypothetical protein
LCVTPRVEDSNCFVALTRGNVLETVLQVLLREKEREREREKERKKERKNREDQKDMHADGERRGRAKTAPGKMEVM